MSEKLKSKTDFKYRWCIVLLCTFSLSFFSYTSQDLSTQHDAYKQFFSDKIPLKEFDFYFNTLYSTALFIIIFLDVYVGNIVDKYGPGFIFVVQATCICTGQFIFVLAIKYQAFYLLYIGRFLVYAANSTTLVSNSIMTSQYFLQNEMGLAAGITTTIGVFGVATNLTVAPRMTESYGLLTTSTFTWFLTFLGFCFVFIAYTINKSLDAQIRENVQVKTARRQSIKSTSFFKEVKSLPRSYWFFHQSCYLANVCGTMIGIIGPAFLTETYNMSSKQAGSIASILPLASISVPFIGKLVDKLGKPLYWMIVAGVLNGIGCFGLTVGSPMLFFLIFGISYAIRIATTMPILTLVVGQSQRGKAFGLIRSFRDVSGFLFTFLNGYLHETTGTYRSSLYLFAGLGVIITIFAVLSQRELSKQEQNIRERRETRKASVGDRKSRQTQNSFLTEEQIQKLQLIQKQQEDEILEKKQKKIEQGIHNSNNSSFSMSHSPAPTPQIKPQKQSD